MFTETIIFFVISIGIGGWFSHSALTRLNQCSEDRFLAGIIGVMMLMLGISGLMAVLI